MIHEINKNLKEQAINSEIGFPTILKDNYIFPPIFYEVVENEGYSFSKISLNKRNTNINANKIYEVAPSCNGKRFAIEYSLKIKLKILSSSDEIFFIPIDFCPRPNMNVQNNNNLNQINSVNYMNNNRNNNMNSNMDKYFIFNYNKKDNKNSNNYNNNISNYNSNINNNYNNINNNAITINDNSFSHNNANNNHYNQNDNGNYYMKPEFDENKDIMGNNNLNIQPQNQIFDNDNENLAPPPVLNYNHSDENKS